MRKVIITTTAGTSLTYPHETVPVVEPDGVKEKYVGEVKRGDRVLYHGQHVPVELDQIVGILYSEVPGYRDARQFCFARDNGYETTKLRQDIVTSLATNPDLFEPEELSNLGDHIFRRGGLDFSPATVRRMTRYLKDLLSAEGIEHQYTTYRAWVDGDVIHPEDLDSVADIAIALNSDTMLERAETIRQTPKSGNLYFQLTNAHKVTAALLAAPKGMGTGTDRREKDSEGRVFEDLPSWYSPVIEKLKPRIEEGVVEATVYDINIVQEKERVEDEPTTGLHKGVLVFGEDEQRRTQTYQRLQIREPERRRAILERNLGDVFGVYRALLESIVPLILELSDHYSRKAFNPLISVLYPDRGERVLIVNPNHLRFLSPLFDYRFGNLADAYRTWADVFAQCLEDSNFRRQMYREINRGLPKTNPWFPLISSFYRSSLLLRSLYSENEFIHEITVEMRGFDLKTLDKLAQTDIRYRHVAVAEGLSLEKAMIDDLQTVFSDRDVADHVRDLRDADYRIPSEVTIFRSFPIISPLHKYPVKSGYNVRNEELRILFNILQRYGIDPESFMEMQHGLEIRIGNFIGAEVGRINEKRKIEGRPRIEFGEPVSTYSHSFAEPR